ncbi:FtsX-like permease family protein [compost metagenome]|jgi:putative ABC transport system permease protein|uniref:ABC transporter permease n=1 Tax=Pseudomonas neuropathica TaxID=2730425 RepID=A0ACC7N4S0_9PSED|nr:MULTISPECIES: FtsX-like permease family protein [Pseudomonas]MDD2102058.1 FtsX-like permease family protein [Pseudomonas putida]MEB2514592.1 FtsX-like permease family protein [Pseudomonas sp. YuFO20]
MRAPETRGRRRLLLELAARDLWHDRNVSLCIVASLVAVIAPLLLLFGLKYGVVTQLRDKLLRDPSNLQVQVLGNYKLDRQWFQQLNGLPGVGFNLPLTRSLNTVADLFLDPVHFVSGAEVIPSANGDPLLGELAAPQAFDQVVLSASAARKLGVGTGERIHLLVQRKLHDQEETGQLEVNVSGILAEGAFPRPGVLVTLELLEAIESLRDGDLSPLFGLETGNGPALPREFYSSARIYAKGLDEVAGIAQWLQQRNIESKNSVHEIESVKAITRVLGLIFSVIAWTAVMGCTASLAGAFLANIDRKRKGLALLRLLGFRRAGVGAFVMIQAALLTCLAFILGYGAYLAGSAVFNHALGVDMAKDEFACRLENIHVLLAFVSALLLAVLVAGIGVLRAIQIQPSESLRDI